MSYAGRLTADAGAPAGLLEVRRHDLALVLALLRSDGSRSRVALAAETGLTRSTVSSLVSALVARSLVAGGATAHSAVGRPSPQVDLDTPPDRVFAPRSGGCRVEPSTLGYPAAPRGGALEAQARVFADPTAVGSSRPLVHPTVALSAGAPA